MMKRRQFVVGAAVAAWLAGCDKAGTPGAPAAGPPSGGSFKAVDITGAQYARSLALTDQFGAPRTLADFKGKVIVVFFGYTQCPDVCPTTMAELAQVKKALGADGERMQAVFVTVDPERDKPELLKQYMAGFDASFIALRGSVEQTAEAAKEFKVFFAKVPGKTETSYTVDHTAGAFLFDPQGRVRLFARHSSGVEAMTADVRMLLAGA
jgi:protein SCO1/2